MAGQSTQDARAEISHRRVHLRVDVDSAEEDSEQDEQEVSEGSEDGSGEWSRLAVFS